MGRRLRQIPRGLGAVGLFDRKQEHLLPHGIHSAATGCITTPMRQSFNPAMQM
jgi:hypothetical protein